MWIDLLVGRVGFFVQDQADMPPSTVSTAPVT
jgi:hypothetical protein